VVTRKRKPSKKGVPRGSPSGAAKSRAETKQGGAAKRGVKKAAKAPITPAKDKPGESSRPKKTAPKPTRKRTAQKEMSKVPPAISTEVPDEVNSFIRYEETTLDRRIGQQERDEKSSLIRIDAVKQARQMLLEDGEGLMAMAPVGNISNWVQLGPTAIPHGQTNSGARVLVTGRVTSILIDPDNSDVIYCGTAQGGVWRSDNRGRTWVPKCDDEISLAIGALAMDPTDHLILYAGTGEGNFSGDSYYGSGLLKTVNGGQGWTLLGENLFAGARFCRIVISSSTPSNLFAATTAGLFRSTDSGQNWAALTGPPLPGNAAATDVALDPHEPSILYVAFRNQGVFKTTTANNTKPAWTKLTIPATGIGRIALGISPSSPQTLYALMAQPASPFNIDKFFVSNDQGANWAKIDLPGGNIGGQGFYNINVAVDPTTPEIVYLSGVNLWRATRNAVNNSWDFARIGDNIHPDNHAFAFDPKDHLTIYTGNDGGIYRSTDGGVTWDDSINEGLCITQFEFMDQHPLTDAVIFAGTQDNGTEQFRNSPVFNHVYDGDGGFVVIDREEPWNIVNTYVRLTPNRSTQAGKFGTFSRLSDGLSGSALFYAPLTLDQTNSKNIAIGGSAVFLDQGQGALKWPSAVILPGATGLVSAISYTNSNLIYVGTHLGEVYRLTRDGETWSATAIHRAPLPTQRWVWDIAPLPNFDNTVIVIFSGFLIPHVWQGVIGANGMTTWTDVSGTGDGRLPDIPVNALVIDPDAPGKPNALGTMYIATDVAVFRTTDGGLTWARFSQGLPNCAVFDMKLYQDTVFSQSLRLLRAATHGRGLWERRLDVSDLPDVDLYLRDNLVDTGRLSPSPSNVRAPFEDPLQHVALGDRLFWWHCADIKVDALEGAPPSYQISPASSVDYVIFESRLTHRQQQPGKVNRVYVLLHNRGIQPAEDVNVKVLYANATVGLPDLPDDFWSVFPNDSALASEWKPIGPAQTCPTVSPTEPSILQWDWSTPAEAADHTCLLVIADSASDPIPASNKVLKVATLVASEKHVGSKSLSVVNLPAGTIYWTPLKFFGDDSGQSSAIRFSQATAPGWRIGLLLPAADSLNLDGIEASKPNDELLGALKGKVGEAAEELDLKHLYEMSNTSDGGTISNVLIPKQGLPSMLLLVAPDGDADGAFSIMQERDGEISGGITFALRTM
jgi:photosystem II stability/assembly factor-like uncharacterized protein